MTTALLQWYQENKRPLPWRQTKDPYHIWVSEIMAQQTQINTLLPYFHTFIQALPTVQALAAAPMEQILGICAGIGYYNRFHNMKKAAEIIVSTYNGEIPKDAKTLQKLPGIGAYAAGAIASTAFGQKVPAIDGNVLRVMSRIERIEADVSKAATKNAIAKHLMDIMPADPGDFNQALMELGALVCKPQNPSCSTCPVASFCKGQDICHTLPIKPGKKAQKEVDKTVLLLYHPEKGVLMRKRVEKLLHGMWEFYHVDDVLTEGDIGTHVETLGYTCTDITPLAQAVHVFTHLKWHMTSYLCQVDSTQAMEGYVFVPLEGMEQLPIPVAFQKVFSVSDIRGDFT